MTPRPDTTPPPPGVAVPSSPAAPALDTPSPLVLTKEHPPVPFLDWLFDPENDQDPLLTVLRPDVRWHEERGCLVGLSSPAAVLGHVVIDSLLPEHRLAQVWERFESDGAGR